jgi:hypothetical protein
LQKWRERVVRAEPFAHRYVARACSCSCRISSWPLLSSARARPPPCEPTADTMSATWSTSNSEKGLLLPLPAAPSPSVFSGSRWGSSSPWPVSRSGWRHRRDRCGLREDPDPAAVDFRANHLDARAGRGVLLLLGFKTRWLGLLFAIEHTVTTFWVQFRLRGGTAAASSSCCSPPGSCCSWPDPGRPPSTRSHRKREGMAGAFAGIAGRRGRAVKERAEGPRRALVGPRRD